MLPSSGWLNAVKTVLLLSMILLAGCATTPEPLAKNYAGPQARIHDTAAPVSFSETGYFQLTAVNGHNVPTKLAETATAPLLPAFAGRRGESPLLVPAGQCLLTIEGVDQDAFDLFGHIFGMFHVRGGVTVNLEPGKEYFIRGKTSEYSIDVWVEDGAGRRISDVIRKTIPPPPDPRPLNVYSITTNYYSDSPHPNDNP